MLEVDARKQHLINRTGQRTGQTVDVPEILLDDASTMFSFIDAMDTAKPPYRENRRLIVRLKRQLRKFRNAALDALDEMQEKDEEGKPKRAFRKHRIGVLECSLEALEFLCKAAGDPQEGIELRGAANDTLMMLEDCLEAAKKKDGEKAGDGEDEEVGAPADNPKTE